VGDAFGERFLRYPDLFPARPAGASCGNREVAIDFSGGPYRFRGMSEAQEELVRARFGDLGATPTSSLNNIVETVVFEAAESDFLAIALDGWEYTIDLAYEATCVRLAGLGFMARLDWRPHLTGAIWTSPTANEKFPGVFENFFRALASYRLLQRGGTLIHSCAVVDDGHAYLFFGHSGAGKTTIARSAMRAGKTVLSDDMNAIDASGNRPSVEKVPFAGVLGRSAVRCGPYPLAGIYRLRRSSQLGLRRISRAQALAGLFACSPYVNADPFRNRALLASLERLLEQARVGSIDFPLGVEFDGVLRELRSDILTPTNLS
jgi:hypothetical protein